MPGGRDACLSGTACQILKGIPIARAAMTNRTLDNRVSGVQFELARHPRVELASIKSMLQRKPSPGLCIDEASPLREALPLIAGGGAMIVLARDALRGTLSAEDLARAWLSFGEISLERPVGMAMSACAHFVSPAESLEDALRLMRENSLRLLPVIDSGKAIALLALEDLLEEKVTYLANVCKERELDQQIAFLRGTYSC